MKKIITLLVIAFCLSIAKGQDVLYVFPINDSYVED